MVREDTARLSGGVPLTSRDRQPLCRDACLPPSRSGPDRQECGNARVVDRGRSDAGSPQALPCSAAIEECLTCRPHSHARNARGIDPTVIPQGGGRMGRCKPSCWPAALTPRARCAAPCARWHAVAQFWRGTWFAACVHAPLQMVASGAGPADGAGGGLTQMARCVATTKSADRHETGRLTIRAPTRVTRPCPSPQWIGVRPASGRPDRCDHWKPSTSWRKLSDWARRISS